MSPRLASGFFLTTVGIDCINRQFYSRSNIPGLELGSADICDKITWWKMAVCGQREVSYSDCSCDSGSIPEGGRLLTFV